MSALTLRPPAHRDRDVYRARRVARKAYAACEAAGRWPGRPDDVQTISPPVWAAMAHEERYQLSSEIKV